MLDVAAPLVGRGPECSALDRLLDAGQAGESGTLVLRGEPGVGKSALLDYAACRADGARVLRATGIESESELAFASLHQLLVGVADRFDALPDPQAAALRGAFGLAPAQGTDPFLISLAVLSALAELAEEQPVLCLVDDAQWIDDPSASALLFAARRIEAEGIAIVFAVREGETRSFEAPGLPSLRVDGLDEEAARVLLERAGDGLAPAVREQLVSETAGNALALVELSATLTPEQLSGRAPLAQPLPLAAGLEASYLARVQRLPEETQQLLLFAAAEDSGELAAVLRASASAGLDAAALEPAEHDGLVTVSEGRLDFRHPLVRSAIYQGSTFNQRRSVHNALAEAQDEANADRRAWHRAAAAEGPDEQIALELDAAAERATVRGGHAAASSALAKAARLSTDGRARTLRLLGAADEAWLAGKTDRARALLANAIRVAPADLKVHVTKLQGRIDVRSGDFANACADLMEAARGLAETDPKTAIDLLAEAEDATFYTGDLSLIVTIGELAESIAAAEPVEGDRFTILLLVGLRLGFTEGTAAGAPMLREAMELAKESTNLDVILRAGRISAFLGRGDVGVALMQRALRLGRESGALGVLPRVLAPAAWTEWRLGRYASGRMYGTEALRLARETGQEPGMALTALALIAGSQGRDEECRTHAAEAMERARERGASLLQSQASWALGLLELAHGRFDEAARVLERGFGGDGSFAHPALARHMIPDYVEAAVRAGGRERLQERVDDYELWARNGGQPWSLGLLEVCRALMADEDGAVEAHFQQALELLSAAERPFEYGRTQLLFGEFLRRHRRRREAREHLRGAMAIFEQLGSAPWEERASNELRATGETARKRDPSTLGELTPQELQIARLVASGARNREVAAQLFLSPRTIDYHLRKVFMKLGIASRAELAQMDFAVA